MYPTITQYISAISIPESFATKTTLKPVLKDDGTPYFSSGGYAVVFKMECTETHKPFALKCFLKEQEHRAESFRKISDYLATLNTPYLLPYEYLENELWVEDADFPVLLMEWVEGESLNEYLADLCHRDDTEGIAQLAGSFDALGLWLLEQELAHGDLKPDNIIVRNTGQIVLIDYDGLFVPTMAGEESRELGTQDWRHPQRKYSDFNRHLDDFSVLVISLSLHIFKASPDLYKHNSQTDNLLFTEADYLNPYQSAAFTQARNWQAHEDIAPRLALLQYAVSIPVLQLIGLDVHLKRTAVKSTQFKATSSTLTSFTETVNGVSFKMVAIEGGTFTMGSPKDEVGRSDDETQHSVTLSNFYLGQIVVTQALWIAVMGNNPSIFEGSYRELLSYRWEMMGYNPSIFKGEDDILPVERVSWNECQEFISKLNILTGKKYRLPTEAEWEYAARGGNRSKGYIYAGSNIIDEVAWHQGNSVDITHKVATKKPNELELYDMAGNVWEWCNDWYGHYPISTQTAPKGPTTGSDRVIRGGSWDFDAQDCRSAGRSCNTPSDADGGIGFRLALCSENLQTLKEVNTAVSKKDFEDFYTLYPLNRPSGLKLRSEVSFRGEITSNFEECYQSYTKVVKSLSEHKKVIKATENYITDYRRRGGSEYLYDLKTYIARQLWEKYAFSEPELKLTGTDVSLKCEAVENIQEAQIKAIPNNFTTFTETVNGVSFKMVAIAGGTFTMGSPANDYDRRPDELQHSVTLSDFFIGATTITQKLWLAIMGSNPSLFKGENLPVEQVRWDDCQEFISKLNMYTKKKYRLPTEAEWEYACRAGTSTPYNIGEFLYTTDANCNPQYYNLEDIYRQSTIPVCSFPPNKWGLYDMHGNVWEWCSDWYGPYESTPQHNPKGPDFGTRRVLRGGSWMCTRGYCRSMQRESGNANYRNGDVGIRLCISK